MTKLAVLFLAIGTFALCCVTLALLVRFGEFLMPSFLK